MVIDFLVATATSRNIPYVLVAFPVEGNTRTAKQSRVRVESRHFRLISSSEFLPGRSSRRISRVWNSFGNETVDSVDFAAIFVHFTQSLFIFDSDSPAESFRTDSLPRYGKRRRRMIARGELDESSSKPLALYRVGRDST